MGMGSFHAAKADQDIPIQNYGPSYFYPKDPAKRLYRLPWLNERAYTVWDGYGSEPGGSRHVDYSVDFGIPYLDTICAVRGGTVVGVLPWDSVCGQLNGTGNQVIVANMDSIPDTTRANGWRRVVVKDIYGGVHRNIPVRMGQKVAQGEAVAFSHCTGTEGGMAHLHFRTIIDSTLGYWGHCGWFDFQTGCKFASVPTPFVEITQHPNGLPEQGDVLVSQNRQPVFIETSPQTFQTVVLLSAWPNPFHARTEIRVHISETSPFSVGIFRTDGRLIAVFSNGAREKSERRSFIWDASVRPAGLYLVRLQTGETAQTLKILRLR